MKLWEFSIMAILALVVNLAFLAGAAWVVVKVLQYMGVL